MGTRIYMRASDGTKGCLASLARSSRLGRFRVSGLGPLGQFRIYGYGFGRLNGRSGVLKARRIFRFRVEGS